MSLIESACTYVCTHATLHLGNVVCSCAVNFCSLDDNVDHDHSNDVDSDDSATGIIIGVTLGVVFTIISIIIIICIIKKKFKKISTQDSTQSNSFGNDNSSHSNTRHTEAPHISKSNETAFTTFTPAVSESPTYNTACQPPVNCVSVAPDDIPSYPPPDYTFAHNYTSPDYTCVVSSDNVTTT